MRKDFALCFNDGYVPYACVTIKSIVEHMNVDDDVHIHIVSDYISDAHRAFIEKTAIHANVRFYIIEDNDLFTDLPTLTWSIYTWYRLLLPKFLDIDVCKVLYLDCDVIVNDSLDGLFSTDLETKSIAACIDIQAYNPYHYKRLKYDSHLKYICAGVLLINIDKWRKDNISTKIVEFAKSNSDILEWPDQDAINYVCREDKIILPARYGVLVPFFRSKDFVREHFSEMEGLIDHPAIVHYAGYQPWIYQKNKSMHSSLWWRTYWSLHAFPKVWCMDILYAIKYLVKVVFIHLKVIRKGSECYVFDLYYHHPRVKSRDVVKLMESLKE